MLYANNPYLLQSNEWLYHLVQHIPWIWVRKLGEHEKSTINDALGNFHKHNISKERYQTYHGMVLDAANISTMGKPWLPLVVINCLCNVSRTDAFLSFIHTSSIYAAGIVRNEADSLTETGSRE